MYKRQALNRPCEIELYSDAQYLGNAFNQHWIEGWIKKGWKRGKNEEVKNVDCLLYTSCENKMVHELQ